MRTRERLPQEELFPFVAMEELIPENHILRRINRHVDFSFIHELVDPYYSDTTGRPAIDPELLLRILTLGYLYNLSENKLFEELKMHAGYRWFCNLGFYDPVPDRTTFNKIKNHMWIKHGIMEQAIHQIVLQCVNAGLVTGKHLAVDGTQIRANASIKSLEPIVVEVEVDEYLTQLNIKQRDTQSKAAKSRCDEKDFRDEKFSNDTHRSTTDPDARLYKKAPGKEASLSYVGNMLIDTKSRVILGTKVTQPGISTESDAALSMLDDLTESGLLPESSTISTDKGYGSTEFIVGAFDRGFIPHTPLLANPEFEPIPSWKTNTYIPERQENRARKIKEVKIRNLVRELAQTREYKHSQQLRKHIEHIFAEGKTCHGLARAKYRGHEKVEFQLRITAMVQNIKRLSNAMHKKAKNAMQAVANTPVIQKITGCIQNIIDIYIHVRIFFQFLSRLLAIMRYEHQILT